MLSSSGPPKIEFVVHATERILPTTKFILAYMLSSPPSAVEDRSIEIERLVPPAIE